MATAAGGVSGVRRFLGWCVHLYTATGLIAAAVVAALLVRGGADAFRWSFALMLAATIVDATDGTLARLVRIKEAVPGFDGRKLDDLTDFLTYTCLPLMLIWRAGLVPSWASPWLVVPLLASAYGFCRVEAKTADGYFLGFPSLWNVVAFYLYVLHPHGWLSTGLIGLLSLLTIVPSVYLYPSQPGRLNLVVNVLGALWAALLVPILLRLPAGPSLRADAGTRRLALASLAFPIYYMAASWLVTLRRRRPGGAPIGK